MLECVRMYSIYVGPNVYDVLWPGVVGAGNETLTVLRIIDTEFGGIVKGRLASLCSMVM